MLGIYAEAQSETDEDRRTKLAKHAVRSESASKIKDMILMAESEKRIRAAADEFDGDPWSLNVANGIVDLKTGELHGHDPAAMHSKIAKASYVPGVPAPRWDAFLERILPDAEVREFVQKFAGYSMTGDVSAQALAFLWGGGSNGKTTFLEALRDVLGGYAYQAGGDLLVSKRERGAGELAAMAKLRGRRFVTTVEVDDGKRMAEGLVKELTGERTINAKLMRQNPVEFVNVSKVWLAANHKPEVRGQDWAMWRRIKLVPFTVTIPDEEKDDHLGAKLAEERDGILRWLIEGCLKWQRDGLKAPEAVSAATAQYREESNPLQDWIEERCEVATGAVTEFSELREDYLSYCKREAIRMPLPTKRFGSALKEHGFEADKGTGGVRVRRGIRLRGAADRLGF